MGYKEQAKAEADRLKGKVDYYADHIEGQGKLVKARAEGWIDRFAQLPFAVRFGIFFVLALISIGIYGVVT
jgi:hypothetical protein